MRVVLVTFLAPLIAITIICGILVAAELKHGNSIFDFRQTEPWMYFGPFPGLLGVYVAIIFYAYIGVSGITICVTGGQLTMSLILDTFGLLGFDVKSASPLRISGVVLVCIAAVGLQLAKRSTAVDFSTALIYHDPDKPVDAEETIALVDETDGERKPLMRDVAVTFSSIR